MEERPIIELSDDTISASFDSRTGALIRLRHRALEWYLVNTRDGGLSFSLSVPRPGRRVAVVDGLAQQPPVTESSEEGIIFRWNGLVDDNGEPLAIDLEARVRLENGQLTFSTRIANHSDRCVEMAAWPQLHVLRPRTPGGCLDDIITSYTLWSEQAVPMIMGVGTYWGSMYPDGGVGQYQGHRQAFHLLQDREHGGGFYLGLHDAPPRDLVVWHREHRPGFEDLYAQTMSQTVRDGREAGVDFDVRHFPFVAPDASAETAPIVIAPYDGDWHAGVAHQQRWRATWFRPPKRPAWVEDVHSWLQVQIYSAEDRINFRYVDLPDIARECKECGIAAIQLTGWAEGGQDRGNPSHDTDPALGTFEELRDAIATCHAMGVRIILFSKFTWWDQSRSDYDTDAQPYLARDPYGHTHPPCGYQYFSATQRADINTCRLIPTCTASTAWQDRACEEMRKLARLGAAGTLYDECQHHNRSTYCFAEDHGHRSPAYLYAHDVGFAARLREAATNIDPEFLLAGEACTDAQMLAYDLAYTRFERGHVPGYRTVAPDVPIMMAVPGFDDRCTLNKCLEYRYIISYEPFHFKGRPSDMPKTIAYGNLIDALRRRYRRFLWDGTFRSARGASVTLDGETAEEFSVYEAADGRGCAVVVCNCDTGKTVQVDVAIDQAGDSALSFVTPENPAPQPFTGSVTVPPRSVVVVIAGDLD